MSAIKNLKIRPLDDRVVVQPVEAEDRTAGGIVLPDSAKEKPQRGHVVAIGAGKLLESGQRAMLSVSIGDEVIYGKYSGSDELIAFHYFFPSHCSGPPFFSSTRSRVLFRRRALFFRGD